jgi:hypothetical protein
MRTVESRTEMQHRAEEVLRLLLAQVSAVKLRGIQHDSHTSRVKGRFVAHIEVLGRSRALACEVRSHAPTANLRKTIEELHAEAAHLAPDATPVLIAPYLPPEAQAICKECRTAFLDLEGNARLALGEVFIGKRSVPVRNSATGDSSACTGQEARTRPLAPTAYLATSIPAAAPRVRTDTAAIVGVA